MNTSQPSTNAMAKKQHMMNDQNGGSNNDEKRVLIGCVITITVLLLIILFVMFCKRSRLRLFFKQKNRAIVVMKMFECNQQRRNAITEENGDIFEYKTNFINAQVYTINLDEATETPNKTNLDEKKKESLGIDVSKYTNLTPIPDVVMTTTTTTTTTKTMRDGQTTNTSKSLPTYYQPSTGLHVRKVGVKPGYETVTNFKQRTTDDITIKKVEVIRTYSLGTPQQQQQQQQQQQKTSNQEMELSYPKATTIKDEEEKHYDVPTAINHYQVPTNNNLMNADDNIEPYQVSNVNGAFLGDSKLEDEDKQQRKLDSLLGDLDHGYGLIKEQRKAMQQQDEQERDEKKSDIDGIGGDEGTESDENKRSSLHKTISVGIYAEREGKIYYPGHVVEIAGHKNT